MQPGWTLMGVAECTAAPSWNLARLPSGPLEWVMRSELRPGREPVPGQAHWVAHARADWSLRHLEESAEWVQARLQAALADFMRHAVRWRGATVHRWRYALPAPDLAEKSDSFWWDSVLGLGVCGDFLGGAGVEGAWRSGRALAAAVLEAPAPSRSPSLALLGEISP
jgi:predicted NAD/FAD-dependent oxidoreductase